MVRGLAVLTDQKYLIIVNIRNMINTEFINGNNKNLLGVVTVVLAGAENSVVDLDLALDLV